MAEYDPQPQKQPGWLRRQFAEHPLRSGIVVALLSGGLTVATVTGVEAAPHQSDRPPGYTVFDDPAWPHNVTLPSKDCSLGAPIDHQQVRRVAGALVAMVDTRCEPPYTQPYAGVYVGPGYDTSLVGSVYNGWPVSVICNGPGVPVSDPRGGDPNMNWVGIVYKDAADEVHRGRINAANLGQLDVASIPPAELPACG